MLAKKEMEQSFEILVKIISKAYIRTKQASKQKTQTSWFFS
jgi:hypothetical protein